MDAFVRFLEHTLDAKVVSYVNRRTLWIAETRVFLYMSQSLHVVSYIGGGVNMVLAYIS
jgi:hypothetical protein